MYPFGVEWSGCGLGWWGRFPLPLLTGMLPVITGIRPTSDIGSERWELTGGYPPSSHCYLIRSNTWSYV
jgi:hypothetical protein